MGINTKDIGTLVWKILRITTKNIYTCRRTRRADLKHQRSVRRNARRKVEEVGKDWDSSQASEDERDQVILTTLYGEFPNPQKFKKDKAFLATQEFSFEPNLDEEKRDKAFLASQEYSSEPNLNEVNVSCSSSSSSSEGEEKESFPKDTKIIAWTDDDQKNLLDLGNSEMERNKRLEHLITRRRTRRQVLLAAERSLMDMEVPPVCVGRNYFGLDHDENYMIDGLQMPESAPSVLLPTKNPFDLPYGPQEEKPNLSGDSFHQEFSEANPNPRESFFSHHESFCRRNFPPSEVDSRLEHWKKSTDGLLRPQQGTLLRPKQPLTIAETKDMEAEHRAETVVRDLNTLLAPQEMVITDTNISDQVDSSEISVKPNGDQPVGNALKGVIRRNTVTRSTSLAPERQIYMEHFGYSTVKGHKVTKSGESDLQVEFSEVGSPPTTVDWNHSDDDDEKSLFVNESDTGKETVFTAESQMLPVEKLDQDFNMSSQESDAAKQFEEEERSKAIQATVPHTNEVILEEPPEHLTNSVDEMKMSYESDEPGTSERRANQEMQEIVEPEASVVNQVTSDESDTSPTSVLPDISSPLGQTLTVTSEDLELSSASQQGAVIHDQELSLSSLDGDRNSIETEVSPM
ncbi:BnaA08g28910D [Brassica napus]|uniref:BnaA08g28910D protein n=1 Tax=Brassica napus TaxID=3708 RepID=A0A078FRY8_BRANA|nr:BnaA08g28910D [Brassica napus]